MAGRKRKAKITLPGMQGRVLVSTEVPDPYAPERREKVKRAVYGRTIEAMAAAGRLRDPQDRQDGTEARVIAANRFLALYGRCGGSGARAIDYSAIKVDVSFRYDGTPEMQAAALQEMAKLSKYIGADNHRLLHAIICNSTAVTSLIRAERRRMADASEIFYAKVRAALDDVAEFYGVAHGKNRGRRVLAEIYT